MFHKDIKNDVEVLLKKFESMEKRIEKNEKKVDKIVDDIENQSGAIAEISGEREDSERVFLKRFSKIEEGTQEKISSLEKATEDFKKTLNEINAHYEEEFDRFCKHVLELVEKNKNTSSFEIVLGGENFDILKRLSEVEEKYRELFLSSKSELLGISKEVFESCAKREKILLDILKGKKIVKKEEERRGV